MKDVINYIIENAKWRILKTKRVKADFGKRLSGIITFEHRKDKGYVLGAISGTGNSANGYRLFLLLLENIPTYTISPLKK